MLLDVSTIRWLGLRVHTFRDVIITGPNYHDHETKPTKVNEKHGFSVWPLPWSAWYKHRMQWGSSQS